MIPDIYMSILALAGIGLFILWDGKSPRDR